MVYTQYERSLDHRKAAFLNLHLSKEEAVDSTISLVDSLNGLDAMTIYTDGSYNQNKGRAGAAISLDEELALLAALGINPYYSNHEYKAVRVLLALHLVQLIMKKRILPRAFILTDNMGVIQRLDNCNLAKPRQYIFHEIANLWRELKTPSS